MQPNSLIFTPLLIASLAFFVWALYSRLSLVTVGRPASGFRGFSAGFREMLVFAFGQKRVLEKGFGFNHLVIFWACITLVTVNVEFMVAGMMPTVSLGLLPDALYLPIRGASDIMAGLTVAAIAVALVRRTFAPPYPQARTFESYLILGLISVHMAAYLGVSAAEIALGTERAASWMPVASRLAGRLSALPAAEVETLHGTLWWLHAAALIAFITVLIPFTKHMHVITSIANCFFHPDENPTVLPREEFTLGKTFGVDRIDGFSWKDLFDSFACTKCGRCENACPAATTGKQLNPRAVMNSLRLNLLRNGPLLKKGLEPAAPLIGEGNDSIAEEAIWSCTTCGACIQECPALLAQMPKLVKLRRHLVETDSQFPEELLNLFENMEQRSNPWGIAPSERVKWCSLIEAKPFEPGKTEYLFFVGCAGAFDSRNKQVTLALAQIMDRAGISWGILGKDEKCCGDSLRRLGNEFVFERMANENVALFRERGVKKIVTQCPHCFSTLKNDYAQYGIELEVIHHSQLIAELLQSGRLKLNRQVDDLGKIVFHDSCYLGRHNGEYDAPRAVIAGATGDKAVDMPRAGKSSFCCGAGGGRMWMEEHTGKRINHERVEEALAQNPDTVCVSCPYCMTMVEDGLKDKKSGHIRVRDIAEVVAEGLRG